MPRFRALQFAFGLVLTFLLSSGASATTIHGVYTSTIDTSGFGGQIDDLVTLDYFYSTPAIPIASTSTSADYGNLTGKLTIGTNMLSFSNGGLYLWNNDPDPLLADQYFQTVYPFGTGAYKTVVSGTVYGNELYYFDAWLIDAGLDMIASLVLPMSLDTTKVDSFGQYICVKTATGNKCAEEANPFTLSLTVVPEVPLPAALPLLAAGLGAMGFMGWRRKRRMA